MVVKTTINTRIITTMIVSHLTPSPQSSQRSLKKSTRRKGAKRKNIDHLLTPEVKSGRTTDDAP